MTLGKGADIIDKEFEFGGVAQLARAIGSYPVGHLFESDRRYHVGAKQALLRFSFAKENFARFLAFLAKKSRICSVFTPLACLLFAGTWRSYPFKLGGRLSVGAFGFPLNGFVIA